MARDEEPIMGHDAELLRLIEGSPQPQLSLAEIARQIGEPEEQLRGRVDRLARAGRLRREGDRLIAVDPATGEADPRHPIP